MIVMHRLSLACAALLAAAACGGWNVHSVPINDICTKVHADGEGRLKVDGQVTFNGKTYEGVLTNRAEVDALEKHCHLRRE